MCENKNTYFLRREIFWGCVQWKRTCVSFWTPLASHKSQVGEEVEFQVAISKQRQMRTPHYRGEIPNKLECIFWCQIGSHYEGYRNFRSKFLCATWESKTPRRNGVSCVSVNWNPYSSIGFVRQCSCAILWPNLTATQRKRSYMLTYSWAHGIMIAGQPIISFCHGWSDTIIYLQTEATEWWALISAILSSTSAGRGTWSSDTLFWHAFERTQQQTLHLSQIMCSSYKKGSDYSLALFPFQLHVANPPQISFAVLLASDSVFTPYVLRQRHGTKVTPLPVTCVMLMMSKMSSMFFFTAPIPKWFLSAENLHLCFPKRLCQI